MAVPADSEDDDVTVKQEQAIIALLNEPNIQRAALAAGVGERTLYRWLKQPEFIAAYRTARRDAFGQSVAMLQRYSQVAANTFVRVMTDTNGSPSAKVSAASAVFRICREGVELDDLAVRVEAVEQSLKEKGQ